MVKMKDFPPEFVRPFSIALKYFKSCHVEYFDNDLPFWRKYWRFVLMSVFSIVNYIALCLYLFRALGTQGEVSDVALMAPPCLIALQSILKAIVVMPKNSDIEKLIKGLAKMWRVDNLSDIQINERDRRLAQCNFGQSAFYVGASVAISQNLAPQLIYTVVRRIILQQECELLLPFGYVYPFDPTKNWGLYLLVYASQSYSILRFINYYLGLQLLITTLCCHLSIEFAMLREDIKHVVPVPIKTNMYATRTLSIEAVIRNHQELIRLAEFLNDIFKEMVFIDLCFFATIICFFAVRLTVSYNFVDIVTNTANIFTVLVIVYTFCYYCEMLNYESGRIADAAYENLWYEGSAQYQKTMGFIIMRAQHPCYMTSLNYVPITLSTFTKVVSTTWSYFSLAMTMYNKN